MEINGWGIKLPLNEEIRDAYYVVSAASGTGLDGKPNAVWLGRTAFGGEKCDPSNNDKGKTGALGAIIRFSPNDTDEVSGKPLVEEYPDAVRANDYYYVFRTWSSDNPCASKSTLQSTDAAFSAAIQGIKTENEQE